MESGEDVPFAVKLPAVDLVEERHEDERVEDHREVLRRLRRRATRDSRTRVVNR